MRFAAFVWVLLLASFVSADAVPGLGLSPSFVWGTDYWQDNLAYAPADYGVCCHMSFSLGLSYSGTTCPRGGEKYTMSSFSLVSTCPLNNTLLMTNHGIGMTMSVFMKDSGDLGHWNQIAFSEGGGLEWPSYGGNPGILIDCGAVTNCSAGDVNEPFTVCIDSAKYVAASTDDKIPLLSIYKSEDTGEMLFLDPLAVEYALDIPHELIEGSGNFSGALPGDETNTTYHITFLREGVANNDSCEYLMSVSTTTTTLVGATTTTLGPTTTTLPYTATTPCFEALRTGDVKTALRCLYVDRDDGAPVMGYWFYGLVVLGMVAIFYVKNQSISYAAMLLLVFMGFLWWSFPPEAAVVYWGIVVFGVAALIYDLFIKD